MKLKSLALLLLLVFLIITMLIGCNSVDETVDEVVDVAIDYPSKPISIIVPWPPGGMTDLAARPLANALSKVLDNPVVVVNVTGGGGLVGGQYVVSAEPDGYTIGYLTTSLMLPEYFRDNAPYSRDDLEPVCWTTDNILAIVVRNDSPWQTLEDFIEYARNNPGVDVGVTFAGSEHEISARVLMKEENIDLNIVPLNGDAGVAAAVAGGHIPIGFQMYAGAYALAEAGDTRMLAVFSDKRMEAFPDVPTLWELGYLEDFLVNKQPQYVPAGTPAEIVEILEKAFAEASKDPEYIEQMKNAGLNASYGSRAELIEFEEYFIKNVAPFNVELGLLEKLPE